MEITGNYLKITGNYLEITGEYWRLLEITKCIDYWVHCCLGCVDPQ